MIGNYIKVALRTIIRHKGYSFINIAGLSVGMTVCILIMLFVQFELSYDSFHENGDDLYMVASRLHLPQGSTIQDAQPGALAPTLEELFPEVVHAARAIELRQSIRYGENSFNELITITDPSMLEMFTFPLVEGDPATALADPHSIVLSARTAEKYFGGTDPLGQILRVDDQVDFKVTGILADIPANSTLRADCVVPLAFMKEMGWDIDGWGGGNYFTYVQLQKGTPPAEFGARVTENLIAHYREMSGEEPPQLEMFLHPLTRLHLYSLGSDTGPVRYMYILLIIAVMVLLIACINFINLSTARSSTRAREIGMRKIVGAHKGLLVKQFMGESLLYAGISLVVALGLVELVLPGFNTLTGRSLELKLVDNPVVPALLMGILIVTGIIAGSYPALFLAAFKPITVLRGAWRGRRGGATFRKALVVSQFSLSIFLLIGTIIIGRQFDYFLNKDLGFDRENIVFAQLSTTLHEKYDTFRARLLQNPHISNVGASVQHIRDISSTIGKCDWEGKSAAQEFVLHFDWVGYDYIETMNMKMAAGRAFSRDFPADMTDAVILNERAVELMGLESPVGKRFSYWGMDKTIVGVVKNFHFQPLQEELKPFVFICSRDANYVFMKIKPEDASGTLAYIEDVWQEHDPGNTPAFHFLSDTFERMYPSEQRMRNITRYFAGLAIFIASLGLFGLASFTTEQRTREIGVRKVLGASVTGVVLLLSRDYVKWVLIANVIAWPAAYVAVSGWLQNFAYRTDIGCGPFVVSGIVALAIALLTVSYQSIKAGLLNPVRSLRHE